jgi:hypothetical protein
MGVTTDAGPLLSPADADLEALAPETFRAAGRYFVERLHPSVPPLPGEYVRPSTPENRR